MAQTGERADAKVEVVPPIGDAAPVAHSGTASGGLRPPPRVVPPGDAIAHSADAAPLAPPSEAPVAQASLDLGRLILRGGAWSLGISAAGAALSLGVHLVLARTAGPTEYGRYVFAMAWMNVFALVGKFELDTASVRFVGAYSATGQWSFLRGFLHRSTEMVGGGSLVIAGLGALTTLLLFRRIERETGIALLAACVLLPVHATAQLKASVIQGLKHVARAQAPGLLVRPVLFVTGVLAIHFVFHRAVTAPVAILFQAIAAGVALLLTLWFVHMVLPAPVRAAREAFDTRYWMTTAAGLLVISAGQIVLSPNAAVLVLGSVSGPAAAGRYAAASQLALAVSFGVSAVSFIALPIIADLHARRATAELQQVTTRVARLGLSLGVPVLLVLIAAARPALSAFGASFADAWPLLVLLGLDQLIGVVFGIAGYLLVMTGHQGTAARVIVGCAALSIVLTLALAPAFGPMGAGVATIVTTVVRSYVLTARMRSALGVSLAPWPPRAAPA